MKLFLTDVDGVILDWHKGFVKFLKKEIPGFEPVPNEYTLGLPYEKIKIYANIFNGCEEFSQLEPLRDAKKYITQLNKDGYRFVAITSCLGTEKTFALRMKNLTDVFGDVFEDVICIPIHGDKLPYLKRYKDSYWVEDKMKNAVLGPKAGHTTFLVKHFYNESDYDKNVTPVNTWEEIYNSINHKS